MQHCVVIPNHIRLSQSNVSEWEKRIDLHSLVEPSWMMVLSSYLTGAQTEAGGRWMRRSRLLKITQLPHRFKFHRVQTFSVMCKCIARCWTWQNKNINIRCSYYCIYSICEYAWVLLKAFTFTGYSTKAIGIDCIDCSGLNYHYGGKKHLVWSYT